MRSGACVQPEAVLHLGERAAAGRQVAGAPGLVQRQRLLGVARDGLHQGPLVAALRHPQVDRAAAPAGRASSVTAAASVGSAGTSTSRGTASPALAAVQLQQQLLDEVAGVQLLDPLDDQAALPAHPAAADVEHLDRRLERVVGERDDVGVGAVAEHDRVLLHRPPQRADVVAQPGGPLVVLRVGRGAHLRLEPAGEPLGLAGHEVAEVVDDLPVLLGADPPDAGRRALADVAEQAGPADLAGAPEDAGAAGAGREDAQQQVERSRGSPTRASTARSSARPCAWRRASPAPAGTPRRASPPGTGSSCRRGTAR